MSTGSHPLFPSRSGESNPWNYQAYDWDWAQGLDEMGKASQKAGNMNPMAHMKNLFTGGNLRSGLQRAGMSDFVRGQAAQYQGLQTMREGLDTLHQRRGEAGLRFDDMLSDAEKSRGMIQESIDQTQSKVDTQMDEYFDQMFGGSGYMSKLERLTEKGARDLGRWGDKAVESAEASRDEFKDFSSERSQAAAHGMKAKLESQLDSIDNSNLPQEVKEAQKQKLALETDKQIFATQTELQNQTQASKFQVDQATTNAYFQRGNIEQTKTQMESLGLQMGADAATNFHQTKAQFDAELGQQRTASIQSWSASQQQIKQAKSEMLFTWDQVIGGKTTELAKAEQDVEMSLMDYMSGVAAVETSSPYASNRLSNIGIPGSTRRVRNRDWWGTKRRYGSGYSV